MATWGFCNVLSASLLIGLATMLLLLMKESNVQFDLHSSLLSQNPLSSQIRPKEGEKYKTVEKTTFDTSIQTGNQKRLLHKFSKHKIRRAASEVWTLEQKGHTGVSAMQLSVISDTEAIVIDKVEHNPLTTQGHPAWAAIYNLDTQEVRALNPISNTFCAAGSFLGNGTLINVGGNAVVDTDSKTGTPVFGDLNGVRSIRFFTPCKDGQCDIVEFPDLLRLTSARWYPTVTRLPDGSAMIMGGSKGGGWKNRAGINNPSIEYFPPKKLNFAPDSPQVPIHSPFLVKTLASNLYPILITLPIPDMVFAAANNDAMLYNWRTGVESPLPSFPNGVRVSYPFTGTGILLPLTYRNEYQPEIFICGGSSIADGLTQEEVKVSDPASDQCVRMILTERGIAKGWEVEKMPQPRIMPDAVMMPDGKILIVNGGMSGTAGYGNLSGKVGNSNADHPALRPVLYDPEALLGSRFSSANMPTSTIARLYHSVATLTPSGQVMITGSNPNADITKAKYPTEYRVEWLSPPYITDPGRPSIATLPSIANFSHIINIVMSSAVPLERQSVMVVLMDLGFVTHSVHMNSRSVELKSKLGSGQNHLSVQIPTSPEVYPPGYGWIFVVVDGIPSKGRRLMIGTGNM